MGGRFGKYWEMTTGGPYRDDPLFSPREVFKCTGCGAETMPERGFNGEPNRHICGPDCKMEHSDLRIGASEAFIANYQQIDWNKGKQTSFARMK